MGLLTVDELAKKIKVSKSTIYLMKTQKRIPVVKIGSCVRFDEDEIEKWLENQKIKAAA